MTTSTSTLTPTADQSQPKFPSAQRIASDIAATVAGTLFPPSYCASFLARIAAMGEAPVEQALSQMLTSGSLLMEEIDGEPLIFLPHLRRAEEGIALKTVLGNRVIVITGGPGVGKTTLVNSILRILRAKGVKCLLCAPTGRAAKRLTETTGMEAKTIHRQLEINPATGRFTKDESSPRLATYWLWMKRRWWMCS